MKNYFSLLFALSPILLIAQNTWTQKSNLPAGTRMGSVAFTIGSKGYVGTGYDWNATYYSDFWEYDPVADSWTQKANFPGQARFRAGGFATATKGYISTGQSGTLLNDLWEYDPVTNSWLARTNMNLYRSAETGFVIGNKIYCGTGYSSNYTNDFWEYNTLTNSWTQKADFAGLPKVFASAFAIGAKGYLGTGSDTIVNGMGTKDFWEYDTTANSWLQKANLPGIGRSEAVGFSIGNFGYIGTGTNFWGSGAMADFWKYDPALDLWTPVAVFPGGIREQAAAFVIDCKAYVVSGFTDDTYGTTQNDLWEYTPDSGCSVIPVADFTAPNNICPGTCTNFSNLSINATTFQWSFPGGTPSFSTDSDPQNICYALPGVYDVELVASGASGSDTLSLFNYMNVFPAPSPQSISQHQDTLIANSGAASYQWYFNGNIINGATYYFYIATQNGDYNVVCTDTNGCEVEAAIFDVAVSVPSLEAETDHVEIFPNPALNNLTISGFHFPITSITIHNMLTEIVMAVHPGMSNQPSGLNLDISMLPPGIYFIQVLNNDKKFFSKFIKQINEK